MVRISQEDLKSLVDKCEESSATGIAFADIHDIFIDVLHEWKTLIQQMFQVSSTAVQPPLRDNTPKVYMCMVRGLDAAVVESQNFKEFLHEIMVDGVLTRKLWDLGDNDDQTECNQYDILMWCQAMTSLLSENRSSEISGLMKKAHAVISLFIDLAHVGKKSEVVSTTNLSDALDAYAATWTLEYDASRMQAEVVEPGSPGYHVFRFLRTFDENLFVKKNFTARVQNLLCRDDVEFTNALIRDVSMRNGKVPNEIMILNGAGKVMQRCQRFVKNHSEGRTPGLLDIAQLIRDGEQAKVESSEFFNACSALNQNFPEIQKLLDTELESTKNKLVMLQKCAKR